MRTFDRMDFMKTVLLALVLITLHLGGIRSTDTSPDVDLAPCKDDADCKTGEKCLEHISGFICAMVDCDGVNDSCDHCGGVCKYDTDKQQHFCVCPNTKISNTEIKNDTCESMCGLVGKNESDIITCDEATKPITCKCKGNAAQRFDIASNQCVDTCESMCGLGAGKKENEIITCDEATKPITCKCKGNAAQRFDITSKQCADTCESMCGLEAGKKENEIITCDEATKSITCKCKGNAAQRFDVLSKLCVDTCQSKCGIIEDKTENEEIKCLQESGSITCLCKKDPTQAFDYTKKQCVACKDDIDCKNGGKCADSECKCFEKTSGRFCEIVDCADSSPACNQFGGSCKFDVDKRAPFCECPETSVFNTQTKMCEVSDDACDKARPKCTQSDGKCQLNDKKEIYCLCQKKKEYILERGCAVLESVCDSTQPKCRETSGSCHVTEDQDTVQCVCPKNKEYSPVKGCSVNKCKEKCGAESSTTVKCEGDPFGDRDVQCKCKDGKLTFVAEEKACRRQKTLTLSAIVGIVVCVIAAVVIAVLLVIYYGKYSEKADYHQNNAETIAFESALYNATYESVEMRNPQEHRNIP